MEKNFLHRNYHSQSAFRNYAGFYADHKFRLFCMIFTYTIKFSPVFVLPILTAEVINLITSDGISPEKFYHDLIVLGLVGFGFLAQNIPTHMLNVHLMSVACRDVERKLRSALCTRLQHLSIPYYSGARIGALQNKVTRDVESIENMTRMLLDGIPGIALGCLAALVMTAFKAPVFLLFYLAVVPIAVTIYRLLGKSMVQRNREFRQNIEDMSGKVTEMIHLIPITRAHHVEDTELSRVNRMFEKIQNAGLHMDYVNSFFGSVNWAVMMLFNLSTLLLIAWLRYRGFLHIGIGDIVLLAGYFATITGSVMGLMNQIPGITKGLESVRSICEILECPDLELNEGKKKVERLTGNFQFVRVRYRYPDNGEDTIHDLDLDVKAGETIAFVGPSGAGKSTIANMIIGFIRPTSGKILLDGQDMSELDLRSYRSFISVVTQETLLFNGSIRENICYGIQPTEEVLLNAVKNADLEPFISSLPDGLETQIRENGARLSGGQKQRIAIARALLRDPRVLILDEATSALDVESEGEIKKALDHLIKGRTTFIVAHRLSTIRGADRIVVLSNGTTGEIGSYQELMAKEGLYYSMEQKFSAAQ